MKTRINTEAGTLRRATPRRFNAGCRWHVPAFLRKWEARSAEGQGPESGVQGLKRKARRASGRSAAADYLSRFLGVASAAALLASGCAGPRPLKGGKAVVTRKPAGIVEQTLVQGENAAQATRQNEENVKVRSYTVPAGSRVEQSLAPAAAAAPGGPAGTGGQECARPAAQPATAFVLSAPMPVIEREETRARTELGAAQKDIARELGARLSSLKGIVWAGAGLFVFGLASLVWPPLKTLIGSVTTSAAMLLGGLALIVLPTMVVGNELLVLGGVALAVGGWFLAHRHGHLRGIVAAAKAEPAAETTTGKQ